MKIDEMKLPFVILTLIFIGTQINCVSVETRQKCYYAIKYWNLIKVKKAFIKEIRNGDFKAAYNFTSNNFKKSITLGTFSKTADSVKTILDKCIQNDTIEIHESWSENSTTGEKSTEVTFAIPFLCDSSKTESGYYDAIDIQFKQNGSKIERFQIAGYFITME